MQIYHYHSETKALITSSPAKESPLEPGVFLIPGFATDVAPPDFVEGQARVFVNGQWQYVPISNPEVGPSPTPIVTNDMVNIERTRRINAGKEFGGIYLTGSDTDRANLSDLAFAAQLRLAAGDQVTMTYFRDGNNDIHELTPLGIISLWSAGASYVEEIYKASWALKELLPIPLNYTDDEYWP